MKAIVLAGGRGIRLRPAVPDLPKPMAPVVGRPFLEILIDNLVSNGVRDITLSVGYRHEIINEYFGDNYHGIPLHYAIEESPLGTGGALRKALSGFLRDEPVFAVNGDTFNQVDIAEMHRLYTASSADVCIALKLVLDSSRYGRVILTKDGNDVLEFEEKGVKAPGYINAGLYLLRARFFELFNLPEKFALEQDCFSAHLKEIHFKPYVSEGYFIDIGVPEDYARAQIDLIEHVRKGQKIE